jgi:hypothetical protein
MIAEVYDALLAAGSPEDKARKAAEAIAGYKNRFAAMDQRFAKVDGDLKLLTWIGGLRPGGHRGHHLPAVAALREPTRR